MGFHLCEYCQAQNVTPAMSSGDVTLVISYNNRTYVFVMPDMIIHYIERHLYRPESQDFIDAVCFGTCIGGSREQTKSIVQRIGYLSGSYKMGPVPGDFVPKLKNMMDQASNNGDRVQTRGMEKPEKTFHQSYTELNKTIKNIFKKYEK